MSIGKEGSLARRVAAAVGALAVGVMGLAGAALTANATDTGNIIVPDAGTNTTLTIHKYSGLEGLTPDDGTLNNSIDTSTHKPLDGVQFRITLVTAKTVDKTDQPINLDTPEGWDLISGVQAKDVTAADTVYKLGAAQTVTTANGGIATADDLPHGLYLVQEGEDTGNNGIVSKTADFLVTLPLPKVEADGSTHGNWIYDVNVYPKNQLLAGPVKTINSDADQPALGVKVGSVVEYTIKQTVPALNKDETYTQARIFDNLKTDELAYDSTVSVQLNGADLVAGDSGDYKLTTDPATGVVSWDLTPAGLAKIKKDHVITVVFRAKVLKVTVTGEVANGPGTGKPGEPGYGSEFNHKSVPPTKTPYSYWGQLRVIKVVKGNTDQKLADAEFAVSAKPSTGGCPAAAPSASDAVATGKSDSADGVVQWNSTPTSPLGLFVANSNDGPLPSPSKDYCLYETKAPAGYILVKDVKTVKIHAGTANLVTGDNDITVDNQQQDHPNLPLTGAAGTVVMTLGGIALVAAGGAAYAISRKRSAR
ncbi:MAG: SpaH/EbpB family LPXTG-anchored major pilin [Bifidobacterium subtile]|jgi:fimbrial isopeptide formation D2 family protein/LPXTG-motif cell wall-anchored protein|nr:SpaH/EbpB family LPXTG-anchored major pilin [Bifidobacterium subtile]MCI1241457.1 SpaH/EbpB family LPXTG-anchored major pilin [Bifidobacterium subtile]MCI1258455.1 SpaH/EbpB family LPXTG-anchored major pilin [Bifidobacterium subtile]